MLKNFLRIAFRTLTRNASIGILNILGLSAGMTAAILIFLWVQNETSFDNYHPNVDRIYRLTSHSNAAGWIWSTSPHPLAEAIHTTLPQVETVTSLAPGGRPVFRVNGELLTEKNVGYIDSNWFRVFHYDFISGSAAAFFHDPYSLILTRSKAREYFGDKDPVGRVILKDSIGFRVAAVIRDNPANSSFQLDVLMPLEADFLDSVRRQQSLSWGGYNFLTFVRLRPNASPTRVAGQITDIIHRYHPRDKKNYFLLTPLEAMHLETGVTSNVIAHGSRAAVYTFTILGIFLLLIACINYVNLTTARASTRAREVGIRKVIGAGKQSLFWQFVIESMLVSLLSLVITLVLIQLTMPFFRNLTGTHFAEPLASLATWKLIGLTLLATTTLNAVYPALLLSSFHPLNVLKGAVLLKFKDAYLRKSLVVLQFTFSIILITGTLVIAQQLRFIQHADPGYSRSQVFYFSLPYSFTRNFAADQKSAIVRGIKSSLQEHSGIAGVTVANESIVQDDNVQSGYVNWEGRDSSFFPSVYVLSADEDYDKVLQLHLQQGRWFDPQKTTDQHNYILNETAVNEFTHLRRPVLGQLFVFGRDTGRIIGIVKDFHFASLHEKINPMVIMNNERWRSSFFVKTQPGNTTAALNAARNIFQSYIHDKPFDYTFLDDQFDALYKTDTKVSTLILLFTVIAIIISCLGLLGLAAFTAQQRTREIGIRKILGATVTNVLTLLARDFILLVFLSILIATPIAWWAMHRWLQDFAYHIPLSAWVFIGAGALAAGTALATILTQTLRAAASNPVKNLRTE